MEYKFRKWDFIKYKGSICQIITISEESDDAFIWFADDELTEHVKYSELEYLPVSESILGRFGFSFDINPMSDSVRCKKCGSYDVYIRAGMFVNHYYCKKCGNEQIG